MAEEIGEEESEHLSFFYFYGSLVTLSLPAEAASEANGHYNTGWEIQHEVGEHPISYLAKAEALSLTANQIDALETLQKMIMSLPKEAVSPEGINTRTVQGDVVSLRHPAWTPVRDYAASLVESLKPLAVRNKAYFEALRS